MDDVAIEPIITNPVWSADEKNIIVTFLEHYKTAYALERIEYLESVFSDDALIIIGNVKIKRHSVDSYLKNSKIVKLNRISKEQYIKNLRSCFARKEFVNIKFEESIIRKTGYRSNDVFGIQIKQKYYSSNYGDTGFLYLLVDLNEKDKPIIHVRTWQEKLNDDGSIYGAGDF